MTTNGREELFRSVKPRYLRSSPTEKQKILDEFCATTRYHRKHAIRILRAGYERATAPQRHRPIRYPADIMALIVRVWELLSYPCGVRLQPVLRSTVEAMVRAGAIRTVSEFDLGALTTISARTLDRRLRRERQMLRLGRGRSTTRHGSLLKSSVPIRLTNWNTREIGFMEMDTVAHCGEVLAGEFIYSLDMVEIASGWSEQAAVMGKGERGIIKAIESVKHGLPFTLKGLDSDTGSEFVNWHMVKWCKGQGLFFTRSRPYYKNDNAYVEQKNYTHIRKWLGYGRYDTPEQLQQINDLYRGELRLWNNFFRPVMKIKSKEKINNSLCRKRYDEAKTPHQRLMLSNQIPLEEKQRLQRLYESLNPVKLKAAIEAKLKRLRQS
jgi:hypothetical protein